MLRNKSIQIATLTLAVLISVVVGNADEVVATKDAPGQPPRYRFEVGQELVYQLTSIKDLSEGDALGKTPQDTAEVRFFVVDRNEDGSWRILVRMNKAFITSEGRVRANWDSLAYCDVSPDGSYSIDERTAIFRKLFPYEQICRLPDRSDQFNDTWAYETPVQRQTFEYRLVSREAARLRIEGRMTTPYQDMHQIESTVQYDFDLTRGFVDRIVWKHRWGPTLHHRIIELVSVTQHDPAWIDRFHKESSNYLTESDAWIRLMEVAAWLRDSDACEPVLQRARLVLVAGREAAEFEILQEMYDANIQEHDESVEWITDSVAKRGEFFDEVPRFQTDWQAKNFDGSTFKLKDQRGKVVVLDFWGTNCEFCVIMAPQVEQLVEEFQGEKVVFVGMFDRRESTNEQGAKREEERAQSFIRNVYKGMPHLDAKEIIKHYRLDRFGYPLLMVLDQSGVVHQFHHGYSGNLARRLRSVIERLIEIRRP